jgi:hypothetical protein
VVNTIWVIIPTVALYLIFRNFIYPYLSERNKLLDKKNKNDLYKLYSTLDPKLMEEEIENYINGYIERYYLYNIATRDNNYINSDDIEDMKIRIIEHITINISELYIFYIKCLENVEDETDLISFIKSKVEVAIIDFVVAHNRTT